MAKTSRKSKQKLVIEYRSIFDNANDAIFIHDIKDGTILDVNEKTLSMFGYKNKKDMLGRFVGEISAGVKSYTEKEALVWMKRAIMGRPQIVEWRCKRKDGSRFWVEVSIKRIMMGGSPTILAFVRDITKRKEAAEAIRESEEKYRTFIERQNGIAYKAYMEGVPVIFDGAVLKITGYKNSDFLKGIIRWDKLILKEDFKMIRESWKKLATIKNYSAEREYRIRKKNGSVVCIFDSVRNVMNSQGELQFVQGVLYDITDRKKGEEALKESEKKYRSLIESMNDGLGVLDVKGKIIFVNPRITEMIGYSKKELIGRSILSFMDEKNKAIVMKHMAERMKGESVDVSPYELEWTRKDGSKIIALISSQGIHDDKGKLTGFSAVITDISERKKATQDFERLFNVSGAMITITDLTTGKNRRVSPGICMATGYSEKEMTTKPFANFIHPEDRERAIRTARDVLRTGEESTEFEARLLCKDGSIKWFVIKSRYIMEEKIAFSIAHDITKRKEAELEREQALEATKQERDKISIIIQSMGDGLFVIDKEGKIVLFNSAAVKMSGYNTKKAIGIHYTKVIKFLFEKDKTRANEFIELTLQTGELHPVTNHAILVNSSGDEIPVANSAAPLMGPEGEVLGCVVIFRDVAIEREIDHMKTEFVSVATHQLHTPLTGIKWFLELLLGGRAGSLLKRQREYLVNVHESNERMIKLINDLLNVSRIESGEHLASNKESTNIIKLFNQIITENIALAKKNHVTINRCKDAPKSVTLPVDENKLRLVINNLLNNAIKYSVRGGQVLIGCDESKNREVTFWIKDKGVGIPKRQQGRIFEKFFRADNIITKVTEGTGLGLYIARSIVQAHGGRLWFESKEGKGSTFFFTIPRKAVKDKKIKSKKRLSSHKKKK
jgi:PAS domain S-box-containing protein